MSVLKSITMLCLIMFVETMTDALFNSELIAAASKLPHDIQHYPWQINHGHRKLLHTNPSVFHLLYARVFQTVSHSECVRAHVRVSYQRAATVESILNPVLRWTKSSGINSARLKENPLYCWVHQFWSTKEGRKCWNEERAGFSLYITSCPDTMQWSEPLRAIIYIQISFSAC